MKVNINSILAVVVIYVISNQNMLSIENNDQPINWPISSDKFKNISSTFGESRLDHFHAGIDIPGEDLPVYPISKGRLLWKTTAHHKKGEIPFGTGMTVIVDHGKFWSGYMHLKNIAANEEKENQTDNTNLYEKNQIIGYTGNTGRSGGAHLHYFIYDSQKKKIYNPLMLMPKGVSLDIKTPEIQNYGILLPDKIAEVDLKKEIIMSQEFPIYAKIKDSGEKNERWGIYYLKAFNNKNTQPIFEVVFDNLNFLNGRWRTSNNKSFDDVYYQNWYNIGTGYKKTRFLMLETGGLFGPSNIESIDLKVRDK
ncbi:MAG: M23 family metallopeptidase [Spirochaetia bacterium]|nr:M23 family metallopeptidase [Spirochaetia bacterium]